MVELLEEVLLVALQLQELRIQVVALVEHMVILEIVETAAQV